MMFLAALAKHIVVFTLLAMAMPWCREGLPYCGHRLFELAP
jgi:hypothetical protein